MVNRDGIFTCKDTNPMYFLYQLYFPEDKYSDELGYIHFISEKHKDRYSKYKYKASGCNHEITYPEDGLDRELDNISHYRTVWFCTICKRYVVEIEK